MKSREDILNEGIKLTTGDRSNDYGSFVSTHEHIAKIYNSITGQSITAQDVCIMHLSTKLARNKTSPLKADNYIDGAVYLAGSYECQVKE